MSFDASFVALSNFRCKLAVISMRFGCNIYCDFPKIATNLHQVRNLFETSATLRDKSCPNRTKITACLFVSAIAIVIAIVSTCMRRKLHRIVQEKLHLKSLCVRPKRTFIFHLLNKTAGLFNCFFFFHCLYGSTCLFISAF